MAKCAQCNKTIIFGGVRDSSGLYCAANCQSLALLDAVTRSIPPEIISRRVDELHQGTCPRCQRVGGIDVHVAHSIWSAVILTRWVSTPQVSCLSCGNKARFTGILSSFFLGWWGFPWGILFTPVQISRNIWGIIRTQPSGVPSLALQQVAAQSLASELSQRQLAAQGQQPPPLPSR